METKLIILCATQRCGSTMIVEDLRNTNVMGKAEEYFIPWNPEKDVDWLKSFDAIIEKSRTDNGVSAIKVMANQLANIESCLEKTEQDFNDTHGLFPRVKALFKNARFIRIKRDEVVRQAVSRVLARKTGVNHALSDQNADYKPGNLLSGDLNSYNSGVSYSESEIDEEVININKETLLWDEVLADWGILSPLELHYSQVCKAYPRYLERVSKYVNVEFNTAQLENTQRNIKKLSNSVNDKIIKKYLGLGK